MTGRRLPVRRPVLLGLAVIVALVAACEASPPPTAGPDGASPSPSAATPSPARTACEVPDQTGMLPSERLVAVRLLSGAGADRVDFEFGPPAPGALASGRGMLREVEPPFHEGGSGELIDVDGSRFLEIRFDGMSVADEDGNPTYRGERAYRPGYPALTDAVLVEAYEGIVTWVIGFEGTGCVTLGGDASRRIVSVVVEHGG